MIFCMNAGISPRGLRSGCWGKICKNRRNRMTYLKFEPYGPSPSGKTGRWGVLNLSGAVLGAIYWYSRWRRYVFQSESNVLCDAECPYQIQEYLKLLMEDRRNARPQTAS